MPILERALFSEVRKKWQVHYGDYVALPKRDKRSGGSGWYPHVDLVTADGWQVMLDEKKDDPKGFVRQAKATVAAEHAWKQREQCWGTEVIAKVSDGDLTIDGAKFTVPGPWVSVRANQHLSLMARTR